MIVKPFLYCYNILLVNLKLHLYHFALAILILNIFCFFFSHGREKFLEKEEMGILSYKMSTLFQSSAKEGKDFSEMLIGLLNKLLFYSLKPITVEL